MRNIRPKDGSNAIDLPIDSGQAPELSKTSKRRCISSACLPCRKRKSKCDGGKPFCSTCQAVYRTDCHYDVDSDHRRKAALRRDIHALKEQNGALGIIIASIKTASELEVEEIIRQIRSDEDLDGLAESLKSNVTLGEGTEIGRDELSLGLDSSGHVAHFGHLSNFSLIKYDHTPLLNQEKVAIWTSVTGDGDLVDHLLRLYFCWSHPYYSFFSEAAFLSDMAAGRNKYCSPMLVNAILAHASHYSDRPELRKDPDDPSTAGHYFFEEAKTLLDEDDHSCLTTVQALVIMGLREPSGGRDSSGFQLTGRAVRMSTELGLHLQMSPKSTKIDETEREVRRITFWGIFICETVWSLCIGRPSQLPLNSVSVSKPAALVGEDHEPWAAYDDIHFEAPVPEQPRLTCMIQRLFISLSEIIHDLLYAFYAPKERFTSRKLLLLYKRFTSWYSNLPSEFEASTVAHVIVLKMWFHCAVLQLFRAFIKVDLVGSNISPRQVCSTAANHITTLLSTYRSLYNFRRSVIVTSHISLTAGIIHLLNLGLPHENAALSLELIVRVMSEGAINHAFFGRSRDILMLLAKQWNCLLPASVIAIAYGSQPGTLSRHHSDTSNSWQSSSPTFSPTHEQFERVSIASVPYVPVTSSHAPMDNLIWSPFPDSNMPLQTQSSHPPMALSGMAEAPYNAWEQDGFKAADISCTVPLTQSGYCGTSYAAPNWDQE